MAGQSRSAVYASTAMNRMRARFDRLIHSPNSLGRNFETVDVALATAAGSTLAQLRESIPEGKGRQIADLISAALRLKCPSGRLGARAPAGGWLHVLENLYGYIRLSRPSIVIETGVGIVGGSSTFILQALEDNRYGKLVSIDPDRYYSLYGIHVGAGIPEALAPRHTVLVGGSRAILESALKEYGPVAMFLHDGDHTYSNMLFEFETVWRSITPSGLLVADDVFNSALDEFAARNGIRVSYARYDSGVFGVATRFPPRPKSI